MQFKIIGAGAVAAAWLLMALPATCWAAGEYDLVEGIGLVDPITGVVVDPERNARDQSQVEGFVVPRDPAPAIPVGGGGGLRSIARTAAWRDRHTTGYAQSASLGVKSAYMEIRAHWQHRQWRIHETPKKHSEWQSSPFPSYWVKFKNWDPWETYWYSYKGHNNRSGYAIKRKVNYELCVDPAKAICPISKWLRVDMYLHADGTAHVSGHGG